MTARRNPISLTRSYVRGEALFGFWNVVSKALGGVVLVVLVSALDVRSYGAYILVLSLYAFASGLFLNTLLPVVLNDLARFIAEGEGARAKKLFVENFALRLCFGALLMSVFLGGADLISARYSEDVAGLLRVLAFMFPIEAFYNSTKILLEARLRFGLIAARPALYRTLKLLFLAYFLLTATFGVREALIAYVAASLFSAAIFAVPLIRILRAWRDTAVSEHSVLWSVVKTHGNWPLLGQAVTHATVNLRPWIIKTFVSTEAVALYAVAESLLGAVKAFLPSSTLAVLIPRTVADASRAAVVLLRGTKLLTVFAVGLGLCAALAMPPIVAFFLPHYREALPLFGILLLALPFLAVSAMSMTFLMALRRQRYLLALQMVKIAGGVFFPLTLVYFFGAAGMAMERVLSALLLDALAVWYLLTRFVPRRLWPLAYTFDAKDRALVQAAFRRLARVLRGKIESITGAVRPR